MADFETTLASHTEKSNTTSNSSFLRVVAQKVQAKTKTGC